MVEQLTEPIKIPKNLVRFIYITGCDGTGKTTQANLLFEQLKNASVKVRHVWLRFPFFFSLPLLAYARWRGYSWHEITGKVDHGYWDFSQSKLLQITLPWLLLIDACMSGLMNIYWPIWRGDTVVCERFVLDMLVDLSLAFGRKNIYKQLPGRLYLKLLPKNAKIFILDLDAAIARDRRADLRTDRHLEERLKAYQVLAKDLSLQQFSSTLHVHVISNMIVRAAIS